MKLKSRFVLLALMSLGLVATSASAFAMASAPELETVPYVDINRYLGTWYEIARFDQRFERDCVGVTATYSLREDGNIKVVNSCRKFTLDGKLKVSEGKAWVTDKTTNAKLRVQFFWPFSGRYWIIDLGENYEYAVVGDPSRDYFWILSRTPQMDEVVFNRILERAEAKGFDMSRLLRTLQAKN